MINKRDTKYEIRNTKESESGQIIIVLLLLMLVGLAIGLAYTQRSITDVTTSTQGEQSSRAFSAAEAGIEKALSSPVPGGVDISLPNNSKTKVDSSIPLPIAGTRAGIEYPPIGRETTAQFWFVNPTFAGAPVAFYTSPTFTLYYGNANSADKPAVEVNVIVESNSAYYTKTYYYDSVSARATASGNTFTPSNCPVNAPPTMSIGILGNNHKFLCSQQVTVKDPAIGNGETVNCATGTCKLILARVRFLYIDENHSLALAPDTNREFPPQVQIYNATGTSGQSQKQIQAFTVTSVVPPWFDFALFSVNELRK